MDVGIPSSSMSLSKPTSSTSAVPNFDALFPSILQCFAVISAGYFARKINLLGENETKGVRNLLVYFLAPTMMCQCLLVIEWYDVNWKFLACAFVAKTFVFVGVAATTLFLSNDLCKSGIYAIFATQSNDMALGYPIALSLYSHTHSDYPKYIYLLMPVSLLILNPIGFFVMEVEKRRNLQTETGQHEVRSIIFSVFRGLATNPMVISTIIGIIGNLIVRRFGLPNIVLVLLNGFSVGFVPVALFTLGCTLVSNEGRTTLHSPFATALLLTLAKILLLPLLLRELISFGHIGETALETSSLGTLGFLYGSLPSAPTVFVYSTQYNVAVGQIAFGLALCTFLSAPWLYFSCRMISIHQLSPGEQQNVFNFTTLHANIIGLIASLVGIGIFVLTRKHRRLPHCFIFCFLLVSVTVNIFGILAWKHSDDWSLYRLIFTCFVLYGRWTFRMFTVVLACSLAVIRCISFCRLVKYKTFLMVAGLGVPSLTTIALLILLRNDFKSETANVNLDFYSAWFSLIVNSVVVLLSLVLLIVQYKCARADNRICVHSLLESNETRPEATTSRSNTVHDVPDIEDTVVRSTTNEHLSAPGADHDVSNDDDDELMSADDAENNLAGGSRQNLTSCSQSASCSAEQRYRCKRLLHKYRRRTETLTDDRTDDDELERFSDLDVEQLAKHSIFVALLCVSACVDFFVNAWRVVNVDLQTATYVQLKLLDSILTYGQSVLCVIIFGTGETVRKGFMKKIRKLFYGTEKLNLPDKSQLDRPTIFVCDQFCRRYLTSCSRELCQTVRRPLQVYKNVFSGSDFVDWLLNNALVEDRTSAVRYGRRLILGKVLEHVHQEEHFHDSKLLYQFCSLASNNVEEGDGVSA